jgi:hypothetical protein
MTVLNGPVRFAMPYLAVLAVVAGAGCRGRPHVDGTVAVDTILKAWAAEGFVTNTVVNIEPNPWSAGACARGMVSGLDVLLCEYASDETFSAGEKKMMSDWQAESVATGAAVRTSRTLLAIADRTSADPSGKTIARLIKSFRDQR